MTRRVPTLSTAVARARHGDNSFRGYRVNAQLLGEESMSSMAALAVGGPRLRPEDIKILDELAVAVTVADPRIWPLKVTRVAGAYGSMFAAYAAGNLCMDGALMSVALCQETARRLKALAPLAAELGDDALVQHLREAWPERRPPGFGVPGRPRDERVEGLACRRQADSSAPQPYFDLFERVADLMAEHRGLQVNLTLIFGAIALDLGFEPEQIGALAWSTAENAFLANAVEGAQQAPELLQCLPSSTVRYDGPRPRLSPRAQPSKRGAAAEDTVKLGPIGLSDG